MPLAAFVRAPTLAPTTAIRRGDLGTLRPGAGADATIFSVAPGEYPLTDSAGEVVVGSSRIKIDAIVRGGRYAEAT